jgi:hypothetical protein
MKKALSTLCFVVLASLPVFGAALDGTWTNQNTGSAAPHTLSLTVTGSTLSGTIDGIAITKGGASANSFWFTATRNGVTYSYKGSISANQMTLNEYTKQATAYTFTRSGS